jgi:hypothetical protein
MKQGSASQRMGRANPDPFADLIKMARLVLGDQDGVASIDGITIRIGSRRVLAKPDGAEWRFQPIAVPGRRPGPSPVRVARDYQAILEDVQQLRQSQRRDDAATAIRDSRRLKTLALSWPDATLRNVPAWRRVSMTLRHLALEFTDVSPLSGRPPDAAC